MLELTIGSVWKTPNDPTLAVEVIDRAFIYGGIRYVAVQRHAPEAYAELWSLSRFESGAFAKVVPGLNEDAA